MRAILLIFIIPILQNCTLQKQNILSNNQTAAEISYEKYFKRNYENIDKIEGIWYEYAVGSLYKDRVLNLLDCTHSIINDKVEKNNEKDFKMRYWYKLEKIFPELSIPIKLFRRTIINKIYLNK